VAYRKAKFNDDQNDDDHNGNSRYSRAGAGEVLAVSPDVTVNISLGSGGPVATQDSAAAEARPPLPLEELKASGAQIAPAPLSPAELSAVTTALPTVAAQAPMAIEQLQAAAVGTAPEPQPLGTLEGVGGPPRPRSPEEIGAEGVLPEPLALEQLGRPG
jgi:hypothetical protein